MTSQATQPKTWQDRLSKQSIGIRQAERLMGAQGLDRRGRLVERLVRKTQDGTLGTATGDDPGGEDVIQVGDNHYTVLPAEPHTGTSSSSLAGKMLATAAAALLAGGGGVGAAMWALSGPETTDPPAAVAPQTPGPNVDTDTKYRLRLVN